MRRRGGVGRIERGVPAESIHEPGVPAVTPEAAIGPERVVAIDWSGRQDLPGQRRHIWAATWTAAEAAGRARTAAEGARRAALGGVLTLENGRTRDEVAEWLIGLAAETPRMVVGIDMCFSLPAWFVEEELGMHSAPALWQLVAETHGERWLARRSADDPELDRRFWGKPHKRPAEFSGENLHRMLRATDIDCKIISLIPQAERAARVRGITPKSPFQIGGSGSVGTGSLRGMPVLLRLHRAGFRVWPFDRAMLPAGAPPSPMLVEMYTRLMTGPVHKANPVARRAYLDRLRLPESPTFDPRYAALPRGVVQGALGSEDAFDALVSCMVMTARRESFARLPQPRDPAARIEGWTWAPDVDASDLLAVARCAGLR